MALIELNQINKFFKMGDEEIHALDSVTTHIQEGEFTAIIGTSGSGKSTLMNIIGLLDLPSAGTYFLDNTKKRH